MKVLVVGGAGYIGGAVTDALLTKGIRFTVYDSLLYEPHYLKDVDFLRGDVRDTKLLKAILPAYTHVVWLAAIVGDGACAITPGLTRAVNAISVCWLAKNFDGRIIFMSTCSVYGEHDGEVAEDGRTNPLSLYAKTKLDAEDFLQNHENALIFRLGTVFGISDTYSRPRMDLVANQMPVSALTKGELILSGGDQWRPMIHVKDVANAIVDNLDRPVRGIYNLATVNIQIQDLAAECARITGCRIRTEARSGDPRNYRADTSKASRDGVFRLPLHSVTYGMREFVTLVRSGRIGDVDNSVYFNVRHIGGLKTNGKLA